MVFSLDNLLARLDGYVLNLLADSLAVVLFTSSIASVFGYLSSWASFQWFISLSSSLSFCLLNYYLAYCFGILSSHFAFWL
jgi:hypothetical protein